MASQNTDTAYDAPPSFAEAHQEARRALDAKAEASSGPDAVDDPKDQEVYTWQFDWTDKRGHRWQGSFTNEIASIYQRRVIGMTRARAMGGSPIGSIDKETDTLVHMVAWLQTTLTDKPKWFEDPDKLKNHLLIAEVFSEVASHEATFHRIEPA
jgi:hypothetical protein